MEASPTIDAASCIAVITDGAFLKLKLSLGFTTRTGIEVSTDTIADLLGG